MQSNLVKRLQEENLFTPPSEQDLTARKKQKQEQQIAVLQKLRSAPLLQFLDASSEIIYDAYTSAQAGLPTEKELAEELAERLWILKGIAPSAGKKLAAHY